MLDFSSLLHRQIAFCSRAIYVFYETIIIRLSPQQSRKILFSIKDAWQANVELGFKNSQHSISFAEFKQTNIAAHDLIVPLTIEDLLKLNESRHLVEHNPIPIPSAECIRLCDDKALFYEKLIENNFGNFVPKSNGSLEYPLILKKKMDMWGENTHIVWNKQQEQALLQAVQEQDYIRQEFISGKHEYATHIVFINRKIVCSLTLRHSHESNSPVRGKDETICSAVTYCPYLDLFASILITIGFEGICCIDYKIKNGRPVIFEVNPRFGGSLSRFFFSFLRHLDFKRNTTTIS